MGNSTSLQSCTNPAEITINKYNLRSENQPLIFPTEILMKIFSYLDIQDLCFSIPFVCKSFNTISSDDGIWSKLYGTECKIETTYKKAYIAWMRGQVKIKNETPLSVFHEFLEESDKVPHILRFQIIGKHLSGRTSFIRRFMEDVFNPHSVSEMQLKTIQLPGRKFNIRVIMADTPANSNQLADFKIKSYKSAHALFICFDVTDKHSFESLPLFLRIIETYARKSAPTLIVGTKCDLAHLRQVTVGQALAFCRSKNVDYIETSAKDNINITEAVHKLVIRYFNSINTILPPRVLPDIEIFQNYCNLLKKKRTFSFTKHK